MKKTVKYSLTFCSVLLFSIASTPSANAALGLGLPIPGSTASNYQEYISDIYSFSIKLGGTLTILMIIYAGYRYMTSKGNPSAINEAKEILFGTLSGFALLLMSYLLLNVLGLLPKTGPI